MKEVNFETLGTISNKRFDYFAWWVLKETFTSFYYEV